MSTRHRAGSLRQSNKSHKSGAHASKAAARRRQGPGRVEGGHRAALRQNLGTNTKRDRQNRARQLKAHKRQELWLRERAGAGHGPPLCVGVISLSARADTARVAESVAALASRAGAPGGAPCAPLPLAFAKHKLRVSLVGAASREPAAVLRVAAVADVVMLVLPVSLRADECVDDAGHLAVSVLKAQGLPSVIGVMQGLDALRAGHRDAATMRKMAQRYFQSEFGEAARVVDGANAVQLERAVSTAKAAAIGWRDARPYVLAEHAEALPAGDGLKILGYVRGRPLSVNQLVHVAGVGTFPITRIEVHADPNPINERRSNVPAGGQVLERTEPADVQFEAEPDALAGEQTWPTEAEMAEAEAEARQRRVVRRVKGTSDYQAAWLPAQGEEARFEDGGEAADEDLDLGEGAAEAPMSDQGDDDEQSDGEEFEEVVLPDQDDEDEAAMRQQQLVAAERDELEFPDEVEAPLDEPARRRFAKYRGLKSFRTSAWDVKESLPRDYGRVFQFEDHAAAQREAMAAGAEAAEAMFRQIAASRTLGALAECPGYVASGSFVTVHVAGAAAAAATISADMPLVATGLLANEHRLSVLHFQVTKHPGCETPVQSKEPLLVYTGFRCFQAQPLFSQISLNCNKHKFERFLAPSRVTCASAYGPNTFAPAPVLLFRGAQVVATGTLHSVDPDRLIIKRVVLTGAPLKVRRRHAVVRSMFHSPSDVRYFAPVELRTKYGLTGHIRESVGTHGSMKCVFNKHMRQNDTVCLFLYKRVFPKLITASGEREADGSGVGPAALPF